MYGLCHDENLPTFRQNIPRPIKHQFTCRSRRDSISSATDKNRETDVILKCADLLADCRLRTVDTLGCLREVLALMNSDEVFEMTEFHRI